VESDGKDVSSVRWEYYDESVGSLERAVSAYVALGGVPPSSAASVYMQGLLEASEEPPWTVSDWLDYPVGSWERDWAESRKDRDWLLVPGLMICVFRRVLSREDWLDVFGENALGRLRLQRDVVSISPLDAMVWCNKIAKVYGWKAPYWFSVGNLPAQPFQELEEVNFSRTDVEVFENPDSLGPYIPTTGEWLDMVKLGSLKARVSDLWSSDRKGLMAFPD